MRQLFRRSAAPRVILALLCGSLSPLAGQEASGAAGATAAAPAPTPSSIVSTTLSATNARVTREVEIPQTVGLHTVRIGPLPAQLERDSVQVEGPGHLRVVSVQVEDRAGGDHATPAFQALEAQLKEKYAARAELGRRRKAALDRRERYRSLQVVQRREEKGEGEIAPAPVDPERWQHFIDLVSRGMSEAWTEAAGFERAWRELDEEITKLRGELSQLASPSRRQSATAIVTVQNVTGAAGSLAVRYEVPNALWYPEYSVRIDPAARLLQISCYGVVHQATGEDWPEAPVRFSTAMPRGGAAMPELASYRIRRDRYQDFGTFAEDDEGDEEDEFLDDARELAANFELKRTARPARGRVPESKSEPIEGFDRFRFADPSGSSSSFIDVPNEKTWSFGDEQSLERLKLLEERMDERRIQVRQNAVSVLPQIHDVARHATPPTLESSRGFLRTFTSVHPEPVPSDGAPHRLLIGRIELPFTEERTAVPELMARVFRRLRAPLTGDDPCLAGSAAVFMDGAYLGSSRFSATAPGEELVLDLGVDEQIEIVRRQEDREEEVGVFSKARRYHTTVTLDLVNHHGEAKTIDLRERIPFTEEERISIDLDEDDTQPPPTRVNRNSGLLDWTLSVPAGGKRTVTLRYSIDAPRSFQLTRTPAPQRLEEDDR